MEYEEINSLRIADRAKELGCSLPGGIVLLPDNFDRAVTAAEFRVRAEAVTLLKVLRQRGVAANMLQTSDAKPTYVQNNSVDWVSPTLFLSAAVLSHSPHALSVALGVIANYTTDLFRGSEGQGKIVVEYCVEKSDGSYRRFSYKGDAKAFDPEKMASLAKAISETP